MKGCWFSKANEINKGAGDSFSVYKILSQVLLLYLEVRS